MAYLGLFQVTATSPTCAAVHAESARMTKRAVWDSPLDRVIGAPVPLLTVPSDCSTCTADDSSPGGGSSATLVMTICCRAANSGFKSLNNAENKPGSRQSSAIHGLTVVCSSQGCSPHPEHCSLQEFSAVTRMSFTRSSPADRRSHGSQL